MTDACTYLSLTKSISSLLALTPALIFCRSTSNPRLPSPWEEGGRRKVGGRREEGRRKGENRGWWIMDSILSQDHPGNPRLLSAETYM